MVRFEKTWVPAFAGMSGMTVSLNGDWYYFHRAAEEVFLGTLITGVRRALNHPPQTF